MTILYNSDFNKLNNLLKKKKPVKRKFSKKIASESVNNTINTSTRMLLMY